MQKPVFNFVQYILIYKSKSVKKKHEFMLNCPKLKYPIFSKYRLSAHRSFTQKLQKKQGQVQKPNDLVSEQWLYWQ